MDISITHLFFSTFYELSFWNDHQKINCTWIFVWKCTCTFSWGEGPSVSLDFVRICDRKKWLRYSILICEEDFIFHWKEVYSLTERARIVVSLSSSLPFLFPLPVSICSPKYWVENSKNSRFLGFKLCTVLSSMMKFLTSLLCLT